MWFPTSLLATMTWVTEQIAAAVATINSSLAGKQPLDSDLTAISSLSTTSFGRSLLTQADASATRSTIGLGSVENAAASTLYVGLSGNQTVAGTKTFSETVNAARFQLDGLNYSTIAVGNGGGGFVSGYNVQWNSGVKAVANGSAAGVQYSANLLSVYAGSGLTAGDDVPLNITVSNSGSTFFNHVRLGSNADIIGPSSLWGYMRIGSNTPVRILGNPNVSVYDWNSGTLGQLIAGSVVTGETGAINGSFEARSSQVNPFAKLYCSGSDAFVKVNSAGVGNYRGLRLGYGVSTEDWLFGYFGGLTAGDVALYGPFGAHVFAQDGTLALGGSLELASKTVGTLPLAAASAKKRFLVTDSTPPNRIAFCDGSAWYYEGTPVSV